MTSTKECCPCPTDKAKAGAAGGAKKPPPKKLPWLMRGQHLVNSYNNIYAAFGVTFVGTMAYYIFYNRRRKNQYRDFYANYDAEKSFNRMRAAGIFVSAPPEPDQPQEAADDKKKK